jgi:acetone carboxylase gamma subunit
MKRTIGEYLVVDGLNGKEVIRCKKCDYMFCPITENYKNHTLIREVPLNSLGDGYAKTERFCFREFFCPGCATLLWVDMVQKDLPILDDHVLR